MIWTRKLNDEDEGTGSAISKQSEEDFGFV